MKAVLWFFLLLLVLTGCTPATDGEFPEDDISIIIPYGPGGGFDASVRVLAPYLANELGGDITILPQNVPGAGGRRGSTMVYRAEPDGYTLGIFNLPGFVLPSILGERIDYDLRQLSWIGRIESQNYVLLVSSSSDIKTLEDLQALKSISFLSTGYGSTVLAATQIVADVLGLQEKDPAFITGYLSTSDYLVGLIRGDGNVALAPPSSAADFIESGDLRVLAVSGETSSLEGVATFAELGYPELTPLNLQRSIAGPPGMDTALLNTLRDAFLRTVENPDFRAAAAKTRLNLDPLDGESAAAEINKHFSFYEKFRANLSNPNQ